jgi:hypothetical protein
VSSNCVSKREAFGYVFEGSKRMRLGNCLDIKKDVEDQVVLYYNHKTQPETSPSKTFRRKQSEKDCV